MLLSSFSSTVITLASVLSYPLFSPKARTPIMFHCLRGNMLFRMKENCLMIRQENIAVMFLIMQHHFSIMLSQCVIDPKIFQTNSKHCRNSVNY